MAVDTAVKRHSALHFLAPSVPLPDGTIAKRDRQTLARLYSGILVGEAPEPDTVEVPTAGAIQARRPTRLALDCHVRLRLTQVCWVEIGVTSEADYRTDTAASYRVRLETLAPYRLATTGHHSRTYDCTVDVEPFRFDWDCDDLYVGRTDTDWAERYAAARQEIARRTLERDAALLLR